MSAVIEGNDPVVDNKLSQTHCLLLSNKYKAVSLGLAALVTLLPAFYNGGNAVPR